MADLHATYPAYDQAGMGACALYAFAGAMVASVVTGNDYLPQVGRLTVRAGAKDADGTYDALAMDPAASGYSGLEFHAWFGRKPDGAAVGRRVSSPGLELADLSFRHYPAMTRAAGFTWSRSRWPEYFWDRADRLAALDVTLEADARAYDMVLKDPGTRNVGEAVTRAALDYYYGRPQRERWKALDPGALAAWEKRAR